MSTIAKSILAVLLVLAIAEFAPEAVNAFLILLLVGIIVIRYPYFQNLLTQVSSLGK
jgi:hypothetical protein